MHKILVGQFDYLVKEVRIHYKKKSIETNNNYYAKHFNDIEAVQDNENINKLFEQLKTVKDDSLDRNTFLARSSYYVYSRNILYFQKESYVYLTNLINRNDILIYQNKALFIDSTYNNVIHATTENSEVITFIKDVNELYLVIGKFKREEITVAELSHELARRKFWTDSILSLSKNTNFDKTFEQEHVESADNLLSLYDERFKPFH